MRRVGGVHPDTWPGAVRLVVADLERARQFYERSIGLRTLDEGAELVRLGAGDSAVIELAGRPGAPARPRGTTGLFHLAILVPGRAELARAIGRVVDSGWRLSGASDHLVSEAVYLADPEGNGIEIYRDRPREEWQHADGELRMETLPLDLQAVLGELDAATPLADEGTRLGHVHLNVADLEAAESFYAGALGFDVTVRGYPGALFLSAGGYHHHVGVNTWSSAGGPPPPPGSRGLEWFEVVLPDEEELDRAERRLTEGGFEPRRDADGVRASDPFGNGLLLVAATRR